MALVYEWSSNVSLELACAPVTQTKKKTGTKHIRTDAGIETFLKNLRSGHTVAMAASAIGIPRRIMYDWREADEEFADAWDEAVEEGTEWLEAEANRRAFQGVLEPVYQQGHRVGTKRVYSDTLTVLILKKRNPAFKERHEITGTGKGGAIQITVTSEDDAF